MKPIAVLLFLAAAVLPVDIAFRVKPADFQLYPRDASNMGHIRIQGVLRDTAVDTLSAVILRNNRPYGRTALAPAFSGDSAAFAFDLAIYAELAEYAVRLYADTALALSADSLVAGDALVINGQSNAWSMSSGETYEFVRSWSAVLKKWMVSDRGLLGSSHESGVWANRLGHLVNKHQGIPCAVFNGAQSSMPLANFMPTASNYGIMLRRLDSAGLRNQVKGIFFYQGEANCGGPQPADTALGYAAQFKKLYTAWKRDYPAARNIYVVQLGNWEQVVGMSDYTRNLRDIQRRLPLTCPDVRLMTATGNTGHWGWTGYSKLGDRLYKLLARDVYGSGDTLAITPPAIVRAWYSSALRDRVTLQFDQPTYFRDSLGHKMAKYFALDSAYDVADSGWHDLDRSRITLRLKAPSSASKITYLTGCYYLASDTVGTATGTDLRYRGPFLFNAQRVGALTFHEVPLELPQALDTARVAGLVLTASRTSLLRFESARLFAEVTYGSGANDTNRGVFFRSLDPWVATVNASGLVRGFNPGTGRVVASREGRSDTLSFTVEGALAPLASLRFTRLSRTQRTMLPGDSLPIGLMAGVVENGDTLRFSMDTLAVFISPAPLSTAGGYFLAAQPGDSTLCIAEAGGLRCTTRINIVARPAYVRRINFQRTGAAYSAISGWDLETGAAYSAARGFGWLSAGIVGSSIDSSEEENYFKNTMVNTPRTNYVQLGAAFRLDAPRGDYVLRIVNYNNIACHGNAWILHGTDTLIYNTVCNYDGHRYFGLTTRNITITGDSGLVVNVFGGICYLVLVSADCGDFNLVARDAITWPPLSPSMAAEGPEPLAAVAEENPAASPNPFNPATTIRFRLPPGLSAEYSLFTVGGRVVFREFRQAGRGGRLVAFRFNAREAGDRAFASAVYVGRLDRSDGKRFSHRLVLVK